MARGDSRSPVRGRYDDAPKGKYYDDGYSRKGDGKYGGYERRERSYERDRDYGKGKGGRDYYGGGRDYGGRDDYGKKGGGKYGYDRYDSGKGYGKDGGKKGRGYNNIEGLSCLIKNLDIDTSPQDVTDFFISCGKIRDVYLPLDYHTRMPKGYGFIEFLHRSDCEYAVREMDGRQLHGKEISVQFAQDRRKTADMMQRREEKGGYKGDGKGRRSLSRSGSRSGSRGRARSRSRSRA